MEKYHFLSPSKMVLPQFTTLQTNWVNHSVLLGILHLLKKEELLFQMFAATAVLPQSFHGLELTLTEKADKNCLLSALGILLSIPVDLRY